MSEARVALAELETFGSTEQDAFVADRTMRAAAKYHLIVLTEACIDLANHLIAANRLRVPADYAEAFRILGEAEALPPVLVDRMIEMSRFRNRLVHVYWGVDDRTIHRILNEDLSDADAYIEALLDLLR